ncbi:MAG: molybdenum cofactor biosynthesis F family protein [Oscillospiraceae bacterium]|jgi:hypothetical protein|nr:molybdenum cofactor biosynthesis F family protein [Oscillospiraceae bacterium]
MFFATFNPMTADEVNTKVAASPKATSAIPLTDHLKGRSISLKLEGEFAPKRLDYQILDADTLRVTENDAEFDRVPYSAVKFGSITLLTHIIPGTSRGWHIVLDESTELVTAFETWFGISVPVGGDLFGMKQPTHHRDIPREVQRQYYFGYATWDGSLYQSAKPEKLHTTTNRLEGRGLHWKYSCGCEYLTYFPSVVCSTNVDLCEPRDTVTITYPSDYIRIDDEHYIYAKWGVEFGGEMWLEVLNLFDMKSVGILFGFDENDALDYEINAACIEVTGDAAHLETITLNGDKAPPMAALQGKGARYAYRPKDMDPPMTREEAHEAAKTQRIFDFGGPNIMMSGNTLPFVYDLVGKTFKLTYDHVQTPYAWSAKNTPDNLLLEYEYDISGKDTLKWRAPGGTWHEEKYICFEPARDIYFFSHMLTGDPNFANVSHAVDISTGLSTCVYAKIGSWTSDWEVGATCLFGTAAGAGIAPAPFSRRHGFTNDLVGTSIAWAYSDTMSSIHVYSSPESYSWTIFQDDNSGGATWSSPCFYIKLRDDAYLFQWVEENCNGGQGLVCFNPMISHDGGFFFGVNHTGLSLNITGAYSRKLGKFDIMKYFDK